MLRSPNMPTKQEKDEHEVTHVPPRDCCVYCQQAKSQENPHKKHDQHEQDDEEREAATTTISFDYVYVKLKQEQQGACQLRS